MHYPSIKATTALLALSLAASTAYAVSCTGHQTNPNDLAACANELTARRTNLCTVTRGFTTTFCQIGDARVVGVGVGTPNGKETSSPCVDIAIAVGKILDACTHEVAPFGLRASGELAANNNPDIIVHAVLNE